MTEPVASTSNADVVNEVEEAIGGIRKRKSFSIEDKLRIVRRLKSEDISQHELSRQTGVATKQLREWLKKEEEYLSTVRKREKRRVSGGGRKAYYPEIDAKLFEFFCNERSLNRSVTYPDLRRFLKSDQLGLDLPPEFKISDKYLFCWTKRHKISSRRITHHGQLDNRPVSDTKKSVLDYFTELRQKSAGKEANKIVNMDEVPCYFDMARDTTLHFTGSKNVDGVDTGYRKHRYTVCLAATADGRMLKSLIIFRGLKKVPKVDVPAAKIVVTVSKSGSMDSNIAKLWLDSVFAKRGPYFANTPSVLIWDSYGSHKRDDVLRHCRANYRSRIVLIPGKTTAFLQPLDVALNGPFKAALKREWEAWLRDSVVEYTPKGYRKRPSYQALVTMVSAAMDAISPENILRAFECCGIAANGEEVPSDRLNERLRNLLNYEETKGLAVDEQEDDDGIGADSGEEELVSNNGESSGEDNSSAEFSDEYE